MSVPKLNFRAKPLKLPVFIKPPEKVEKVEEPPPKKPYILYFPAVFLLVFLLRWFIYTNTALHKIKELPCKLDRRTVRCMSHEHKGTFVVSVPDTCTSVYDIGGVPFSSAGDSGLYRVPARKLEIKDVIGKCDLQAYMDTDIMKLHVPFTFVTTKQHTRFSIKVDGEVIVEHAVSSMFQSVRRGTWIAYTYDLPSASSFSVTGDGTDIIHVYPPMEL